ncbi:MAG: glycosyltransferase family 2 protein [Bacteroidales bacterium]|nr:glycosyltransferase family 2 protein [Bacteroidales bacterium]
MKTAIVILNWNGSQYLSEFLPSVIKHKPENAKIYIADNASTDESTQLIKTKFKEVELLELATNYGYAKGYNEALKQIKADYYILLNSDIEVTENWVNPLINYLDNHPNVAACQPKIKSYLQKEYFEYAGAGGGFIDYLGYPFCRGRIFQELEKDEAQYDNIIDVFWASGACMFVRSKVFHELGGFDADFFAHMEEIDFCWRAKNKGYNIIYHPESTVYHIGGGTLPKSNPQKTYLNFRNNFCLLYKNLPKNQLLKVFLIRFVLDGIAAIKFLMAGGSKDLLAVFHSHLYFYRNISTLKKKRKKQEQRSVSNIYQKSVVFEHFIQGKKTFRNMDINRFSQ